ncbi:hypothetical protein GQY15_21160 [Rhodobacter sphaeroides]|uniref:TniQ family protein n=1 Tax=Cereibacter sphaeroides TaxID=1063 RepID=UPI00132CC01E|nr:TniQ family protein [Cereibacter sphaeroides]MWP40068.1 hypothetical protein [Cereibacter sphaeroides]
MLVPVLPMLEGETLMSYTGRVGRFHTTRSPLQFLELIQLRRRAVVEGAEDALSRLSMMTGLPEERLSAGTISSAGDRIYTFGAEQFHSVFAIRDTATFCPACLLEDRVDAATKGQRVGRLIWLFRTTRTCPRHGVAMIRRPSAAMALGGFLDMEAVAGSDEELERIVLQLPRRDVSPLQRYVTERLLGAAGPAWLDGQQMDHGARASEMLGACLEYGTDFAANGLSEDDWDRVGRTGYAYTARGTEGVAEALQLLHTQFLQSGKDGGPQQVFGSLYKWLQFRPYAKPAGLIEDLVRDYILDHFSVEPGKKLLGVPVVKHQRHSIGSLAAATGLHPRTLNRALIITGVLSGDPDVVDGRSSFDAKTGEDLAGRIRNSISTTQLPKYLGCNRTQAQELVRSGVLPRIVNQDGKQTGMLSNVPLAEVDDFLHRLRAAGVLVDAPGAGMMDIVAASSAARWPALDIVKLVLAGALARVEVLGTDLKFLSVLVDPMEVRAKTHLEETADGLSQAAAARLLGVMTSGLTYLVQNKDHDGKPFIPYIPVRNSAGREQRYFDARELARFSDRYIHLKDAARQAGISSKLMRQRLASRGIEPIAPRNVLNAQMYRRSEI